MNIQSFMFCLLNPLLFILLFPSSLSWLLKLFLTLPREALIPEDAKGAFVEKLMMC